MSVKSYKNVLFITRWYPSESDPMLGLFVKNHAIAASMAQYKITVAYVSPSKKTAINNLWYTVTSEENLTEVIVYYNPKKFYSKLLAIIAWIKAIKLAFKVSGKPALIHSHILTRAGLISALLAKWYHIPYVITEHWSRYFTENDGYNGVIRKLLTRYVINHSSSITVVSERLYNAMKLKGLDFEFNLLPNVVNTKIFDISKEHWPVFTFVSITCFEEKSKNLKLLIDSANRLRSSGLNFELVLVGDGIDRSMIEEYSKNVKFDVLFKGTLTSKETADVLKKSHCLVLSSNYETFGIVVYEAMASGLPVITTDVADLKSLINSSNGLIVPVGDEAQLYQAMKKVMENYSNFDPEKIRMGIINKCSLEAVSNSLDELYKSVMR